MPLFITANIFLLISAVTVLFIHRGAIFWDRCSLLFGLGGTICGIGATIFCILHPETAGFNVAWPGIGGRFFLRLDPLSGVFLLPAFFITGTGLLFGTGYWPRRKNPGSLIWIRFFFPLLMAGISLTLTAGTGVLFLLGWEIMALAGYFLVVTERGDQEAQDAGYIYLIATHTGTLALFAMFALLGQHACLAGLPAPGSLVGSSATGGWIFLLALFGFGCKAGIVPLHIWLPRAHAAAPSHVSALMSGVMIKTGIYGIIRITSLFGAIPSWWGWLILALGIISGILGVLFAIAQHDIKRLLAYHSVENIGIILIGLGLALLAKSKGFIPVAVLGLAGALLHVVNHGLFKALLFFSAGSVIHGVGSRQMSLYGGLLKVMPMTGIFFLGGAIAICGLPPLNGFISEWFIYLGLLRGGTDPSGLLTGSLVAVVGLALIGGLALLCFAKVFGLCFLGRNRSDLSGIHEAPRSMQTAMAFLLVACLWIGLLPHTILPLLDGGIAVWLAGDPAASLLLKTLVPAGYISFSALILGGLLIVFWLIVRIRSPQKIPRLETWSCGHGLRLPRAQYSTGSFAEMIMKLFNWALHPELAGEKPAGLFPPAGFFRTQTPDPVLDRLVIPLTGLAASVSALTRRLVQHGMIGGYLLYTAITICLLLAAVSFLG